MLTKSYAELKQSLLDNPTSAPPCVLLIDGDNFIKRHIMCAALSDLKAGGVYTGGIFGMLMSLTALLRDFAEPVAKIYAIFDNGIPAFRHDLCPYYKGERAHSHSILPPEEKAKAYEQLGTARKMLELLGVVCADFKGYEADDGIAAAVLLTVKHGWRPVVVSSDRDLLQVISYGGRVWNLSDKSETATIIDEKNFFEHVGVLPAGYLLYKTLSGDTSDSLRGAEGCGPGRAKEIVNGFDFAGADAKLKPEQQLKLLVSAIGGALDGKKFERAIVADYERLTKEMKIVDLFTDDKRFTPIPSQLMRDVLFETGPDKKLHAKTSRVQTTPFMKMCVKLGFNKVLGDPVKHLREFERVVKRGESLTASLTK